MAREVDLRDVPAALREYQLREGKLLIKIGQFMGDCGLFEACPSVFMKRAYRRQWVIKKISSIFCSFGSQGMIIDP